MKFIISLKIYLTFILIYLVFSTEILSLNNSLLISNKYNSKKFLKKNSFLNSKNVLKVSTNYPFRNPLGNFAAGLTEDLVGGDKSFLKCFPDSWKNKDEPIPEKTHIEANISPFLQGLQNVRNIALKALDFVCSKRGDVIEFIKNNFLKKKFRKYRLMIESGNMTKSLKALKSLRSKFGLKFNPFKGINNFAKRKINEIVTKVKEKAIEIGIHFSKTVPGQIFISLFKGLKDKIVQFIEKLKIFFTGSLFKKVIDCVQAIKNGIGAIKEIIYGLKDKFNTLKVAIALNTPGIVVWVIDFLVALICEYKNITDVVKFFITASTSNDKNQKFYYFGKGIGKMLRTFSTAKTFAASILRKIKSKK